MTQVLIAEDERPIARLIEMSLSRSGYDCTVADNGLTAADLIEQRQSDVALTFTDVPVQRVLDRLAEACRSAPPVLPVCFWFQSASASRRWRATSSAKKPFWAISSS